VARGALFIATLSACAAQDICADFAQSCIALEVRPAALEALSIDQLEVIALSGFELENGNDALSPPVPLTTAVALPVHVAILPPADYLGSFQLQVFGRLASQTLRSGLVSGSIDRNQHLSAVVVLDGGEVLADLAGVDFSGADFSRPPRDLSGPAGADDLSQPCDPVAQSGCPGQKCTVGGANDDSAPFCAAAGSLTVGTACDNDNQCAAGSICLTLTGVDRVCRKFCDHDNLDDNCPAPMPLDAGPGQRSHCLQLTTSGSLGVCSLPCNPVTAAGPSGCPAAQMCYFIPFVNADILGLTDCTTLVGAKTDGQVCTTHTDCAPGFYCREITQGGAPICRQMCRIGQDSDCSVSGFKCVQDISAFGGCCPNGTC
jgi:hypothetical protein